jgi:membrane protease YdiL (CAAX protease family)
MTGSALVPRLALGPVVGVAVFFLLAGGRLPCPRRGVFGLPQTLRWLRLGVEAGLEERIWRGLVFGGLLVAIGPVAALAVSSAGFALWHQPALGRRCAVHVVTGTGFGAAFLAGGLSAAILAHGVYNALVDWAVHGERARLRGP